MLGSVAGGVLADWHVIAALSACALAYAGAVVANLYIPKLAAARPGQSWHLGKMTRSFFCAASSLWRNGETRFSLVGTSLFWGAGVTLRFLVVPLNALLQERGKKSVGAGNAIAVQNLGENSAMLLMLGIYSLAVLVGIPAVAIGIGFGALFALAIAALWIWQRRH